MIRPSFWKLLTMDNARTVLPEEGEINWKKTKSGKKFEV